MSEDELNHWLFLLGSMPGWSVYQVGEAPPPPLIAVNNRHFFTDVVIIRAVRAAVAYRTLRGDDDQPPSAAKAMWTYSGDADSTLAAVFALSRPVKAVHRLPVPPSYLLPEGELRTITATRKDVPR